MLDSRHMTASPGTNGGSLRRVGDIGLLGPSLHSGSLCPASLSCPRETSTSFLLISGNLKPGNKREVDPYSAHSHGEKGYVGSEQSQNHGILDGAATDSSIRSNIIHTSTSGSGYHRPSAPGNGYGNYIVRADNQPGKAAILAKAEYACSSTELCVTR